MPDKDTVLNRIESLRHLNQNYMPDKWRIRAIMNGGVDGIYAVMAWDLGKGSSGMNRNAIAQAYGTDLPTVNLLHSGLETTAQRVGVVPTLKPVFSENEDVRARHMKKIHMINAWDEQDELELDLPQIGRWLPGYSYAMWKLVFRTTANGDPYPAAKLVDPYDVWPGWFGSDQQPADAAQVRIVPLFNLEKAYPEQNWDDLAAKIKENRRASITAMGRVTSNRTSSWEGPQTGVEVIEYWCDEGTYVCVPEVGVQLGYIPSYLNSGPPFVFMKRFAFDKLVSQYHHVIGLMAHMAKFNILALIAGEDSAFRETNVFGELESGTYQKGRGAINFLTPQSRVERPTGEIVNQQWGQIDRLAEHIRIGGRYSVQDDGISPNSFATGAGMQQLQRTPTFNIKEYHKIIRHAMQRLDARRLEAMEHLYPNQTITVFDMNGGTTKYRPKPDIDGDYRTRRVFGAMATFDEQSKMVVGIGMVQNEIMDVETMQENVDGLENLPLINRRIAEKKAEDTLFARLQLRAEQDPRADAALVEIMANGTNKVEILRKYFTPEEPELTPEDQMALAALTQGGPSPVQPEPVSTVLSRIERTGSPDVGVQTVARA